MKKLVIRRGQEQERLNLTEKEIKQRQKDIDEENARIEKNAYIVARNKERGPFEKQLEFIVENGIEAFIERDKKIRENHPKKES